MWNEQTFNMHLNGRTGENGATAMNADDVLSLVRKCL